MVPFFYESFFSASAIHNLYNRYYCPSPPATITYYAYKGDQNSVKKLLDSCLYSSKHNNYLEMALENVARSETPKTNIKDIINMLFKKGVNTQYSFLHSKENWVSTLKNRGYEDILEELVKENNLSIPFFSDIITLCPEDGSKIVGLDASII